jgi:hypothetical protein
MVASIIPAFLAKMYPHRTRILGKSDPHQEVSTLEELTIHSPPGLAAFLQQTLDITFSSKK